MFWAVDRIVQGKQALETMKRVPDSRCRRGRPARHFGRAALCYWLFPRQEIMLLLPLLLLILPLLDPTLMNPSSPPKVTLCPLCVEMLLNPSHTVTFSGLPPDVLDTYVRYKKGTRAIVKWLSQHAPVETRAVYLRAKTLPITDLVRLARIASKHISCMPEVVHFHFRETIAARSSLSKYFRKQTYDSIDPSTVNHEHFTSSLTDIYMNLCECCGELADSCRRPTDRTKNSEAPLGNHFNFLSIENCACSDDEQETVSPISCESCDTGTTTSSCQPDDPELRLLGDELSDAIETIGIIQQIYELYQASQDVWRQAGAGGISLIIASAATNVACGLLRDLEAQLRELNPTGDLLSLHRTCGLPQGQPPIEYETGPSGGDRHRMLDEIYTSWKAVMHVKGARSMPVVASVLKPAEVINTPDFVNMLVHSILHLVLSKSAPDAIIRNGTPAYAEIGYLTTHPKDLSNDLRTTLNLHLLSSSYKSYTSALKNPSMLSNCRLSALKLSQQAQSSLSAILCDKAAFPCICPDTLSFHLHQLMLNLQRYTSHKCFDIYFQAPWVAGNHSLEILDMCFYYGMRLIRYRHYVGAILHSYNILRQLAAMEEVPFFEELCERFSNIFFPGGQRPKSRFGASWARFVGARIKFKKGREGHNHRERWCMAVPSHAAKRTAGFGIGSDGKTLIAEDIGISEVIDLKRMEYRVNELTWDVICGSEDIAAKKRGQRRSVASRSLDSNSVSSHPPAAHGDNLQGLGSYLAQDMRGFLPRLRLNLFAVFETCVKIVLKISNATHTDPKNKELRCICFVTTILAGGDRIRDNEVMGKPDCWKTSNGEREVVKFTEKAIRELMASIEEKDWLWNI